MSAGEYKRLELPFEFIGRVSKQIRIPALVFAGGVFLVALPELFPYLQVIEYAPQSALAISLLTFTVSLGLLSLRYLRGAGEATFRSATNVRIAAAPSQRLAETTAIRAIEERLARLEADTHAFEHASSRQKDEIAAAVLNTVNSAASEDLIDRARLSLKADLGQSAARAYVREAFDDSRLRLSREGALLRRAGTYNLAIGGAVSVAGIAFLTYYLFFEQRVTFHGNIVDVAVHYVPRLSLVILIEAFSLFFLNLYKASLEDIRFFQNELTNVEQRLVAYEIAVGLEEHIGMEELVRAATATERNFILKQGETTIGLERAKVESGVGALEALKALAPFLGKVNLK